MRFWTWRRLPSLISISSSIGTSTCRILSCMSIDSILFSRFFLTFSSWPEYAWTTYHCASCSGAVLFSTAIRESPPPVNDLAGEQLQGVVDAADERANHDHGDDDHQRVAIQLTPGRPYDFA